jgi:hypothetical protein
MAAAVKPKSWTFKVAVILMLIVIAVLLVYLLVPFLLQFERLDLFSYSWVANSKGEIKQLVIVLINNGTEDLTMKEVWVGRILVELADWEGNFGSTVLPEHSTHVYVASKNMTFERGQDYNLTIVTSRENHYSFLLNLNENNTENENVQITNCDFYHWPPGSGDTKIGVRVTNLGASDVIIKKAEIDGVLFDISPRIWLGVSNSEDSFEVAFPWVEGLNYTIAIETVAGNKYETIATAD